MNLGKFEMIPVGAMARISSLTAILGCKVAALPTTYLELPLGASYKAKEVWDGVVGPATFGRLKAPISFEKGASCTDKECPFEHSDLFHVSSCYSCVCCKAVGEITEGFLKGWRV